MEEEKLPFLDYRGRKTAPKMPVPKSYTERLIVLNELRQSRKDAFEQDVIESRANGNIFTLPRTDDKTRYWSTRGFQSKPRASSADSRHSLSSRNTHHSDVDTRLARMRHNILFGVQADERIHRVVQNILRKDETNHSNPDPNPPWLPTRSSSTMIHDCDESHMYEQGNRDLLGSQINEELSSATALLSRAWKRAPWPTITFSGLVAGAPGKRTSNRSLSQGCSPNRSRDRMAENPLPHRQQHPSRLHRDYHSLDAGYNGSHHLIPIRNQDQEDTWSDYEGEEEEIETNTSGNVPVGHCRGGSGYLVLPLRVSYDWSKASSTTMGEPFHKHRQRVEETSGIVILPTRQKNPSSSSGDSIGGGGNITSSSGSSSITYETLIAALYHQCPSALLGTPGADAMAKSFFQPRSSSSFAPLHHHPLSDPQFQTESDSLSAESMPCSTQNMVMRWIPRIWVNHRERISLLERSRYTSTLGSLNGAGGRGEGVGGIPSTRIHTTSISILSQDKGTFLPVLDEHSEVLVTFELLAKSNDEDVGVTNHHHTEGFDPIQYFAQLPQSSSSSGEISSGKDTKQKRNSDGSPSSSSSSIGKTTATTLLGKNKPQPRRKSRQHPSTYAHRHSYWGEKYFHHAEYYATLSEQKSEQKGDMNEHGVMGIGRNRDKNSNDIEGNIEIDLDDEDSAPFDTSNILENDSFEVMLDASFSLDGGSDDHTTGKTKRLQLDVSHLLAGLK